MQFYNEARTGWEIYNQVFYKASGLIDPESNGQNGKINLTSYHPGRFKTTLWTFHETSGEQAVTNFALYKSK